MTNALTYQSSVIDACLLAYGSLELLFAFMEQNGFTDATQVLEAGTVIGYDPTLVSKAVKSSTTTTTEVKTIIGQQGQTPLDIAIQLYGDASAIFAVLNANNLTLNTPNLGGKMIMYVEQPTAVPVHFRKNAVAIINARNVEETLSRAFSMGFSLGFA